MDEKKKKQIKKYLPLIAVIVAVLIIAGASFAFYSANINKLNETMTDVSTNVLGLEYNGVTDIDVSGIIPGDQVTKTFTVRNKTNHAISYNIYMEDIENEFNEDVVYQIFETDSNYENPVAVTNEVRLPLTNENKVYLKTNINIDAKPTMQYYKMVITYKYYENKLQKENNGKSFTGTVGIDTEAVTTYICQRATELHEIPAGYDHSYGDGFGRLGTDGVLTVGDAYDCDVNGDGIYDPETERFYYVSKSDDNDSYVVLLYSGVSGPTKFDSDEDEDEGIGYGTLENSTRNTWTPVLLSNNPYGPYAALSALPDRDTWAAVPLASTIKTIQYWDGNPVYWGGSAQSVYMGALNDSFNYQNKAARLMTFNELARIYQTVNKRGYYNYLNNQGNDSGDDSGYDSGDDSGYDSGYDDSGYDDSGYDDSGYDDSGYDSGDDSGYDSGNDSGNDSGSSSGGSSGSNSDYIPGTTTVKSTLQYGSYLNNIPFLLENTRYYNQNPSCGGIWLGLYAKWDEYSNPTGAFYIEINSNAQLYYDYESSEYYVKPVIEVPRAAMEI